MGPLAIAMIVLTALGIAGSVGTSIFQNVSNKQSIDDTNQKNLQAVQATNAANAEQAELAYKRSLPINQVKTLVDAGMSKAGAIQTLTGGGTYQAPILQSSSAQAPQLDLSGVSSAFERLGNIPANVEQMQLVEQNKQLVLDEAKRKQELHEIEKQRIQQQIRHEQNAEIRRQYGFNAVRMTDKLGAKLYDLASKYGVSWNEIMSQDDLVKKLKLNNEPLWTNAPESAREAAVQNARNNAAENRANVSSQDAHDIAIKHKNQLQQTIDDFEKAKNAREEEYAEREFKARLGAMAAEFGISEQEAIESIKAYRDKDGKLHTKPEVNIPQNMSTFWDAIFSIIPLETISRIVLRNLK